MGSGQGLGRREQGLDEGRLLVKRGGLKERREMEILGEDGW